MLGMESEVGLGPVAAESRSKADVLRRIVTDRLSTAAREILAEVERTVAEYEEEAAGFRQEINRQRRVLGILLENQVKPEPTNACPVEPQLSPVIAVKEEEEEEEVEEEAGGAETPEQDQHVWNDLQLCPLSEHVPGETLVNEEENEEARGEENPEQDQHVWNEQLFNRVYAENQNLLVKIPGEIVEEGDGGGRSSPEDDCGSMSFGDFENLGLISYIDENDDDEEGEELPLFRGSSKQRNKRPRPLPRSGTRTSLRLRMSDPKEFIQLNLGVLLDPHIKEIAPDELSAYPTQEVSCPVDLPQEDFLDLLRVTFPQINNRPFDLFWKGYSRRLHRLHVETLTAEEIQRNMQIPHQSVYIRLQDEVESNIPAFSSHPVTTNTKKMRIVAQSRARKGTENGQGFIDLEILILEDSDIDGQSLQVNSSKQVKVVRCPLGLLEEDFLSQLKSLFPQLEGSTVIELFHTNDGSDLVPVNATNLTPEEIWKSISAVAPGSMLGVRKKATRPAAGAIAKAVSSPAHQDGTQMDQTSSPESPEQLAVLKDSNPVELMHHRCSTEQSHNPRTLGIKPGPVNRMTALSARPKQRTTTEGVRSKLYKAFSGDLPELSLLQVAEVYKDIPAAEAPMICSMGISSNSPLMDSIFGKAQAGSPLSYQQPATARRDLPFHTAPPRPALPLDNYHLPPSSCMFACTESQQRYLKSLEVNWDMVHKLECATRAQRDCPEWHELRRPRLTASRFGEICQVKGNAEDSLAKRILQGTHQTAAMKRGKEVEADAIWEYCQMKWVNYYPCGFVIHPDAPWLGASLDGLVFDPSESCEFGLVEMTRPGVKSYVDCSYLQMKSGQLELKRSHAYYWQVQGQMLITALNWCDFVVSAEDDVFIERIYRDNDFLDVLRQKVDRFFFHVYMPVYLQVV